MRNGERTWIASNHSTCSWRWRNREVEDEEDEEDEKDEDEEEEKDDEVDGHSSPNCCENSSNLLSSRLPYPPPLPPSPPPLLSPLLSEYIQLLLYFEWTRLFSHFGRTFRVSDQLGSCQDNFGIRAPVGMAWERGSGYRRWTKGVNWNPKTERKYQDRNGIPEISRKVRLCFEEEEEEDEEEEEVEQEKESREMVERGL
ncbi:hypothetical protein HZH68_004728 [Vespula germanica]|uniref:Uncharacterized protein n=1 Tax=Vespula germanica TaxID=30212 RepID=A0A834KPG2_VESGE|nr:hypothetical protein HZH68_004728 [Vespula germanica]